MQIIARKTLLNFVKSRQGLPGHKALKAALDAWYAEVRSAKWRNMSDVKESYATASIVGADRIVFNIKGNDYRLVVRVDFRVMLVFTLWIGTHAAYDNIDVTKVKYVPGN